MATNTIEIIIRALDQASAPLRGAGASFSAAFKEASSLSAGMNVLGGAVGAALNPITLAAAGTLALAAGLKSSIDAAADFEKQMDAVGAAVGANAEETKKLSDLALQLGQDTAFSALEAGKGIENLVKNGLSVKQVLEGASKATLDLASSTGGDLASSADILTDSIGIFNKEGLSYKNIVDQITGVTVASKFTAQDYALAIAQGGAKAKVSGVEFADFNAILASTSQNFASGSDAGTSLGTFLQRLIPQSKEAAGVFAELGLTSKELSAKFLENRDKIDELGARMLAGSISKKEYTKEVKAAKDELKILIGEVQAGDNAFFDSNGKMKSAAEVAGILKEKFSGLSEIQRNSAANTIFGTDAIRTFSGLMEQGSEGVNKFAASIAKVDADQQAKARLDNLRGAQDAMKGSLETLSITIGTLFLPTLTNLTKGFTQVINWVTNFVKSLSTSKDGAAIVKESTGVINAVLKAVEPVIKGLGELFSSTIVFIKSVFDNILKPAFITLQPLISGVIGFILERFKNFWQFVGEVMSAVAKLLRGDIVGAVGGLGTAFYNFAANTISSIVKLGAGIVQTLARVPGALIEIGANIVQGLIKGVLSNADSFWKTMSGLASGALDRVKAFLGIASPSRVMAEEVGKPIVQGIAKGMEDLTPIQQQAVKLRLALVEATKVGNQAEIIRLRTELVEYAKVSEEHRNAVTAVTQAYKTKTPVVDAATEAMKRKKAADEAAKKAADELAKAQEIVNRALAGLQADKYATDIKNATTAQLEAAKQRLKAEQDVALANLKSAQDSKQAERAAEQFAHARAKLQQIETELADRIAVTTSREQERTNAMYGGQRAMDMTIARIERTEGAFESYGDAVNKILASGTQLTDGLLKTLRERFPEVKAETENFGEQVALLTTQMQNLDDEGLRRVLTRAAKTGDLASYAAALKIIEDRAKATKEELAKTATAADNLTAALKKAAEAQGQVRNGIETNGDGDDLAPEILEAIKSLNAVQESTTKYMTGVITASGFLDEIGSRIVSLEEMRETLVKAGLDTSVVDAALEAAYKAQTAASIEYTSAAEQEAAIAEENARIQAELAESYANSTVKVEELTAALKRAATAQGQVRNGIETNGDGDDPTPEILEAIQSLNAVQESTTNYMTGVITASGFLDEIGSRIVSLEEMRETLVKAGLDTSAVDAILEQAYATVTRASIEYTAAAEQEAAAAEEAFNKQQALAESYAESEAALTTATIQAMQASLRAAENRHNANRAMQAQEAAAAKVAAEQMAAAIALVTGSREAAEKAHAQIRIREAQAEAARQLALGKTNFLEMEAVANSRAAAEASYAAARARDAQAEATRKAAEIERQFADQQLANTKAAKADADRYERIAMVITEFSDSELKALESQIGLENTFNRSALSAALYSRITAELTRRTQEGITVSVSSTRAYSIANEQLERAVGLYRAGERAVIDYTPPVNDATTATNNFARSQSVANQQMERAVQLYRAGERAAVDYTPPSVPEPPPVSTTTPNAPASFNLDGANTAVTDFRNGVLKTDAELQAAQSTILNTIALIRAGVIPAAAGVADGLQAVVNQIQATRGTTVTLEGFRAAVDNTHASSDELSAALDLANSMLKNGANLTKTEREELIALIPQLQAAKVAADNRARSVQMLADAQKVLTDEQNKNIPTLELQARALEEQAKHDLINRDALLEQAGALRALQQSRDAAAMAAKAHAKFEQDAADAAKANAKAMDDARIALQKYLDAQAAQVASLADAQQQLADIMQPPDSYLRSLDQLLKKYPELAAEIAILRQRYIDWTTAQGIASKASQMQATNMAALQNAAQSLNKFLEEQAAKTKKYFDELIQGLKTAFDFASKLAGITKNESAQQGANAASAITGGVSTIVSGGGSALSIIQGVVQILEPFLKEIAPILEPVLEAFGMLAEAIKPVIMVVVKLFAAMAPFWKVLVSIITPVLNAVAQILMFLGNIFIDLANAVSDVISFITLGIVQLGKLQRIDMSAPAQTETTTPETTPTPTPSRVEDITRITPAQQSLVAAPLFDAATLFGTHVATFGQIVGQLRQEGIRVTVDSSNPAFASSTLALR